MDSHHCRELKDFLAERGAKVSASWGPDAHKLTEDERAKLLLDMLKSVEKAQKRPVVERMQQDICAAYALVQSALRITQFSIDDWAKLSEDEKGRVQEIFGALDMALLHLGNWKNTAREGR